MEKVTSIVCDGCETEFTIAAESEVPVQFCPFCGEYIDEDEDEDLDDFGDNYEEE